MYLNKKDIKELDRVKRLKLINSITGIKPANLVGSQDKEGNSNLAIFSSVVHLGSNPALIGLFIRPEGDIPRHTYENIKSTGVYTINHIHPDFVQNAHYTSAKFDRSISEFDRCGLEEEYIDEFGAPFVKESQFKFGLKYKESIEIPLNGTVLIIGEVEHLIFPDKAIVDGDIDLEVANGLGISGLNSYYSLNKVQIFPFVRLEEVPEFKK